MGSDSKREPPVKRPTPTTVGGHVVTDSPLASSQIFGPQCRRAAPVPGSQREITDCAASGGCWYERNDRLAPDVVHQVPHGVEQPANGDEPIIAEAAIRSEQQYATEEVLAYTESSVEVRATGAGNQDGAEIASVRFLQSRAQTNKERGHNERPCQMGCRKDSSCACLHRLTLGALA